MKIYPKEIIQNKKKNLRSKKAMFYSNVTYNSLKLEATWISSNLITIKQIIIYLLDRILGTHENN